MEKFINEMCDLFGQYGWKNSKESDRITFSKKQEIRKDTEVVVFVEENNFHIIVSGSKYEAEKGNYQEMLSLAEEVYNIDRQVAEWAKRYRKKNFFKIAE